MGHGIFVWTLRQSIKSQQSIIFYHIQIQTGDEWKTVLKTRESLLEWLITSLTAFELSNAPSTFMQMINQVLQPVVGKFTVAYFDDIFL